MGRLIDVDALIEEMKKEQESGKYDENTIIVSDCFIRILNGQPTAYDVEKVVAELEKEKEIHTEHYNISFYKDYPDIKQRYEQIQLVIDNAIAKVKKGGAE